MEVLMHYKAIPPGEEEEFRQQALNAKIDICTLLQRNGRLTKEQVDFINEHRLMGLIT
jgi:hypothetical protein